MKVSCVNNNLQQQITASADKCWVLLETPASHQCLLAYASAHLRHRALSSTGAPLCHAGLLNAEPINGLVILLWLKKA